MSLCTLRHDHSNVSTNRFLVTHVAVASIWFEIWGSWIRVNKILIFPGKFTKHLGFSGNFTRSVDFPGKTWPFTATSGQIILFLFKSHHFRTYFLCMIRYNNNYFMTSPRPPPQNQRIDTFANVVVFRNLLGGCDPDFEKAWFRTSSDLCRYTCIQALQCMQCV